MFERIVVPLDGSPRAEQALPVAARIARASGGSIHVLQVVSPPIDYSGGMAPAPLMTEQSVEIEMAASTSYLNTVAHRKCSRESKPRPRSCLDYQRGTS